MRQRRASVQQLPERVEFVPDLSAAKIGKVDKKALREDIARKVGEVK